MAINVNAANNLAAQLANQVYGLQQAQRKLNEYKSSINAAWESEEVNHINQAIDQLQGRINQVINDLNSVSGDVKNTAAQIAREEAAAAAAAARARLQRQISAAKQELKDSEEELDSLQRDYEELEELYRRNHTSANSKKLKKLEERIREAEARRNQCRDTLDQLRR